MSSKDYWPEKFSVTDIEEAKDPILTAQGGLSSEERWARETAPQIALLREQFEITEQSVVLDFGAGIGRVAKELIEQTGCSVIGVDISANMRALGQEFCNSPSYMTCSVKGLKSLLSNRLHVDFAY
jgi:SAM-dependent methyltransferase